MSTATRAWIPSSPPTPTTAWRDLALLAVAAVALRGPALLAERHLTFDDGVYGASAVAMRDGGVPFRDVFSSQGPVFLPLVRLADLLGFHALDAPRLLGLASALVLVAATYGCARELADRPRALVAAALTGMTGSILWVTAPIASDGPSLAAATGALWLALRYRQAPSLGRAVAIGLAVGVALSTKLMAAPVLVPVGLVLLDRAVPGPGADGRRFDVDGLVRLGAAAATAGAVWLVPSLLFGLADVWDQSVTYHTEVSGGRDPVANLGKVTSTFVDRDPAVGLAALVALGALAARRGGRRASSPPPSGIATSPARPSPGPLGWLSSTGLVWCWLGATAALLLYVHPLWRPHVSGLIPPLALLVAAARPPVAASLAALVVGAAAQVGFLAASDDPFYFAPGGYPAHTAALVAELDRLPPGAWALSDEPGLVWRAGRRTTDDLVDASVLRIDSGRTTAASIAEAAADRRVCAVLVTSGVRWGSFDELPALLAEAGYRETLHTGGARRAFVREPCPVAP